MEITLGEVSRGINEIKDSQKELHQKVDGIVVQTTRTNGRVSQLEKETQEQKECLGNLKSQSDTVSGAFYATRIWGGIFYAVMGLIIALIFFSAKSYIRDIVAEVIKENKVVNLTLK